MKERERSAGVLMPVFSLPGEYGIGTFGKEAKQFIDFLKETGNSVWQVLPMGPTGYGDSPYQSFSSFAINPYFIDLEMLEEEGFLTEEELHEEKLAFASSEEKIHYGLLYERRFPLLRKAYERWKAAGGNVSLLLSNLQKETLDYCLFMALKEAYASCSWQEFPEALRNKEASAVQTFLEEHREDVACYAFMQKKAEEQWCALRRNAGCRFSGIFRYTARWTVRMSGAIGRCLTLAREKRAIPVSLPVFRLMPFQRQDSSGEIRSMTGTHRRRRTISSGVSGWSIVFASMIFFG